MTTGKALDGKPYAGNPHVRFDEGEVAPAATPRRGSPLYNAQIMATLAGAASLLAVTAFADYALIVRDESENPRRSACSAGADIETSPRAAASPADALDDRFRSWLWSAGTSLNTYPSRGVLLIVR